MKWSLSAGSIRDGCEDLPRPHQDCHGRCRKGLSKRRLCTAEADEAFQCRKCDRSVHTANFLALRHARCVLCETCKRFTRRYIVGTSMEVKLRTVVKLSQSSQDSKMNYSWRIDIVYTSSNVWYQPGNWIL
ncbi:hypothetical protein CDL15_Pgr002748 [Punica granatum]|uniref:B box-type domain-containing protein n=1 Tax=Punica granatum TaxID=22663 RepID=A0A218X284_PUNGR|nr:hypothetical protein CDL15_Pgr002748 [Punica granatum]